MAEGEAEGDGELEESLLPPLLPDVSELSDFLVLELEDECELEVFFFEDELVPEVPDVFAVEACWLLVAVVEVVVELLSAQELRNAIAAMSATERIPDFFIVLLCD